MIKGSRVEDKGEILRCPSFNASSYPLPPGDSRGDLHGGEGPEEVMLDKLSGRC